jgi:hypothetical protein
MKASLRLAFAVLALAASLASTPRAVQAVASCEASDGAPCSIKRSFPCRWADGTAGGCACDLTIQQWDCS